MALTYSYNATTDSYTVTGGCGDPNIVIPSTYNDGTNGTKAVTSIGYLAFNDCFSMISITIPNSITSIQSYAFRNCTSLTSVTIPNSVITIGDVAFALCTSLTTLNIGSGLSNIGSYTFAVLNSLQGFNVDTNNPYLSTDTNGVLFNKSKSILYQYPNGKNDTSYTIPDSVTIIGKNAFSNLTKLTSISIPNTVSFISVNAFRDSTSLIDLTIPKSVTFIDYYAFYGCSNLIRLNFLGNAPDLSVVYSPFYNNSPNLKVYRYSTKSGWSSTFGGIDVLLIDSPIHQGLQTFGFSNVSSGKISIKKQNLSSLFDYNANTPKNIYTFKGGTINTISTIFNKNQFIADTTSANADILRIRNNNNGITTDYFVNSSSNRWETAIGLQDASNTIINENDRIILIYFNTDNTPRSVNSGAIIEKYNSGKITLKKN
jgi:hypothetical protein